MRPSFLFLVGAFGLLGCVSFPHAQLLAGTTVLEVVTGPVVCGPVGFRKVPLQSRWGEYVRVTVAAPSALRGTAVVHAGGVVQAEQAWSTEATGALVVEARFPNEDPDRRFVLDRERPIDITLNNLEAPGGTCEGAVFTVEHGALVPSIDERAWIAELERRGGPELAARREAARLEADARRQAHYAQWEARQQVVVSAQLVAQADSIRAAHYAQWDAASLSPAGERVGERADETATAPPPCASGTCTGPSSPPQPCASGTCVGPTFSGEVAASRPAPCASGTCVGPSFSGEVAVSRPAPCASGTCAGPSFSGEVAVSRPASPQPCASGTCAGPSFSGEVAASRPASPQPCASGTCAGPSFSGEVAIAIPNGPTPLGQNGASIPISANPLGGASIAAVSSPGEWSQPPDASLRANADSTWVKPPDANLRATAAIESNWTQPFEPRLEPVAVTTESRVAVAAAPATPSCEGNCEVTVDPALSVVVPALFQMMFNVGAVPVPQRGPVHGARPIGR